MKERGDIPEATEVTLVSDQSGYIRKAISGLFTQIGLGALLVAVVVTIFLRRFLPSLIVVATICLAILIGALGFGLTGETINVMTLGGLALAIGTVVDAAIVVVENVIRHQRLGNRLWRQLGMGRLKSRALSWLEQQPLGGVLASSVFDRDDQVFVCPVIFGGNIDYRGFVFVGADHCAGLLRHVSSRKRQ